MTRAKADDTKKAEHVHAVGSPKVRVNRKKLPNKSRSLAPFLRKYARSAAAAPACPSDTPSSPPHHHHYTTHAAQQQQQQQQRQQQQQQQRQQQQQQQQQNANLSTPHSYPAAGRPAPPPNRSVSSCWFRCFSCCSPRASPRTAASPCPSRGRQPGATLLWEGGLRLTLPGARTSPPSRCRQWAAARTAATSTRRPRTAATVRDPSQPMAPASLSMPSPTSQTSR